MKLLKLIRIICVIPLCFIVWFLFKCNLTVSETILWFIFYIWYFWYISIPCFVGIVVTTIYINFKKVGN